MSHAGDSNEHSRPAGGNRAPRARDGIGGDAAVRGAEMAMAQYMPPLALVPYDIRNSSCAHSAKRARSVSGRVSGVADGICARRAA